MPLGLQRFLLVGIKFVIYVHKTERIVSTAIRKRCAVAIILLYSINITYIVIYILIIDNISIVLIGQELLFS